VAELVGILPDQAVHYGTVAYWLLNCLYMTVIVLLLHFATNAANTAQKRLETELAERRNVEHRLDLALEAGAVGVFEGDFDTDSLRGDNRSFAMFGFLPRPNWTIALDDWKRAIHPDDLTRVLSLMDQLNHGLPHAQADYRIFRDSDGALRHIEASISPAIDDTGRVVRHVGTVVDVTERKLAEQQRERLGAEIRERIKELECLYRVLELTADDSRPIEVICRDVVDTLIASLLHASRAVARVVLGNAEYRNDGWAEPSSSLKASIVANGLAIGHIEIGYVGSVSEPTNGFGPFLKEERVLLEGIALHVGRMLSNRQTAESLRHSERIAALGQLTGGIAHDFNNLLQVILGNSELLSENLTEHARLGPLAQMTMAAAQKGAELTSRLLSFSRRQALSPSRTNLPKLLDGIGALLRRTLGPRVTLDVACSDGVAPVFVDTAQLENAILNLCINARDAMPDGGRLKIELSNAAVAQGEERDIAPGEYVVIVISDTGMGMTQDVLSRAFEPFFTTKPVGHGSGLGLSMVFGFVRQSHGHVHIDSEVGAGTKVSLYLPVASKASASLPEVEVGVVQGGSELVLLVDDDPMVRPQVARLLHSLGYRVTEAASGDEALSLIADPHEFDLLITDVAMPGRLNGVQLVREIEQRGLFLPHILVSGYSGGTEAAAAEQDLRILRKPFGKSELARSVRRALAGRSTRKRHVQNIAC
jgi:signal transduction histidine kinase/PAS domain-containing protein/ActR/RegA family two-component response regulator